LYRLQLGSLPCYLEEGEGTLAAGAQVWKTVFLSLQEN
jgi:hypothetical protein